MRWLAVGGLGMLLAGCGDGSAERQALAQCKVSLKDERYAEDGHYFFAPLALCMQAKGFVEDAVLATESGEKCGPALWSAENAACYRRDTIAEKWLTFVRSKLPN